MNIKNIALFNVCGTIITKSSLEDFIQYAVCKPTYYLGLLKLNPMLTAYTFKLIRSHITKEKVIAHFFKSWEVEDNEILKKKY